MNTTPSETKSFGDYTLAEIGQVPMHMWADLLFRIIQLLCASSFTAMACGSIYAGLAVFFGLMFLKK